MKKKQHYVPRFYLDGFADDNNRLWVYDRRIKRLYSTSSENVCASNMLYETEWVNADARLGKYVLANDVENVFSRYETQFAKVVRRVEGKLLSVHGENEPICNDEEMHLLVRFIANLILRNPKTMELYQLSEIADEIRHDEDIMVICELLDRLGFGGGESVVKAAQKKGVLTEEFGDGETFELMKEIEVLPAHFFLAKQGNFITSDFPVSYGRDRTIKDGNQTAIFLPLTKRTAVLYGMYDGLMGNRMTEINNEIVEELNGIYQKGQNNIICSSKEQRDRMVRDYSGGIENG